MTTETTSPSGEGCNALGGARAEPHTDLKFLAAREMNPPVEATDGLAFLPAAEAVSCVCDWWSLDCGPRPDCPSGPSWEPSTWLCVCMQMHTLAFFTDVVMRTYAGMSVVVISRDA